MTNTRRPGAEAPSKVLLCWDPEGRGRPVAARNPSLIATPASAGVTDGVK